MPKKAELKGQYQESQDAKWFGNFGRKDQALAQPAGPSSQPNAVAAAQPQPLKATLKSKYRDSANQRR
jgi:hypothetical protein